MSLGDYSCCVRVACYVRILILYQIRPKSFVMLPEPLVRERDRVECMSFMGLLPEIDHAYMTVDNVLFLWNYHTQDFIQFRELEQVRLRQEERSRFTFAWMFREEV